MKKILLILLTIIFLFIACQAENPKTDTNTEEKQLKTENDKFSYSAGIQMGESLLDFKEYLDIDAYVLGFRHSIEDTTPLLPSEERQNIITAIVAKYEEANPTESQAPQAVVVDPFLEENKTKEGVITTASGLQYTVLREGLGAIPGPSDRVIVHYVGTLTDGTEFDNSIKNDAPAIFGVTQVIAGWTEALQLMNVGSKYKLFIPSHLAYGESGAGDDIPPNSTLIFEVDLMGIE